jgi:hypothetical protein
MIEFLPLPVNGNLIPVQNYTGLPLTGNGRNSIMVALSDWRITLIFLQLEKLSSPSRINPEGLLSIGCTTCSIGGQVWVTTFVTLFCMEFPCPIVNEAYLGLVSLPTQEYGLLRGMDL